MRDFTLTAYQRFIETLKSNGYSFQTFQQSLESKIDGKFIILRHDVDLRAIQSFQTAKIENELGVSSTYYFRIVPQSNIPEIIRSIADLGHEIGYHYEDLTLARGDVDQAIRIFEKNLAYFRQFYPVKTICMHGSPLTRWDNKDIWKTYDYKDFGIIGEPYFDLDFEEVFYLTDTGRRWDGERVSVRDRVTSSWNLHFHSTFEIIQKVMEGQFPSQVMITTHPQRWENHLFPWATEWVLQNGKNIIKKLIIKRK
ncbi:MAG: hypothetical protein FJY10_09710 [Bacteroidetes bacterium]|nr:hypothetical protein [Bacteroidota bacterium]